MGRRQYIGARYVPKIFDWGGSSEWRSGVQYEVLTIVTRNGSSYTSKIPVPSNIGAPESNPTYWVATGFKGDTGNGIESIEKTGSSGGVDTYTITMTDGSTSTFTVTNGEDLGAREEIDQLKNALDNEAIFIKGNGNSYVGNFTYDIIKPGSFYRVYVVDWSKEGLNISDSAYLFKLGYTNGETTVFVYEQVTSGTLNKYYDLYIPIDAVNPELSVGGRISSGKTGILHIDCIDDSINIDNILAASDFFNILGKGNTFTSKTSNIFLKPGSSYRVFIKKWTHSSIPQSSSSVLFGLYFLKNGTSTPLKQYTTNGTLPEYYDFVFPDSESASALIIGGRLNNNEYGVVTVQCLDDEINLDNVIKSSNYVSIRSAGNNTHAFSRYAKPVIPGHFYKVVLEYWPHDNVPTTGVGTLFNYGYYVGDTPTTIRSIIQTQTLESEYTFFIPPTVTNPVLFVGGRIDSGKTAVVNIVDISESVPAYVQAMIDNINTALIAHQSSNSVSFPFITDIHIGSDNINSGVLWAMLMSKKAINSINKKNPLEMCVFNGDYLNNSSGTIKDTALSWYTGFDQVLEDLDIIQWRGKGNHDMNDIATDTSQHMTNEEYYQYFMKQASIKDYTMEAGKLDKCYGYYDDNNRKIRFILINSVDIPVGYNAQWIKGISNAQLNFVANALHFSEDGWGVVFISHHALHDNSVLNPDESDDAYITPEHGGTPLMGVIDAFMEKTTYAYSSSTEDWEYNVSVDYTSNESSEVIAMLSGHTHYDKMTQTEAGYVMLSTTSAGITVNGKDSAGNPITKVQYTNTETSWDIITIDRKNKMIYADRYGGGQSRTIGYGS